MCKGLLRTQTVNISRYLPDFLQKDDNFRAVCEACSWEHEKMRRAILNVLDQFFVGSATWGLEMWERVLNLHPAPTESYAFRRKKIIAKLQGSNTSTVALMNQIVNAYGFGYVEEHNDKYYFNIYTTCLIEADRRAMKEQILFYRPAHLGVNVYLGFSWNGFINFDGTYTYGTSRQEWE